MLSSETEKEITMAGKSRRKIEIFGRDDSGILLCKSAGHVGLRKPFDASPRTDLSVYEAEPGILLIIDNPIGSSRFRVVGIAGTQ